MSKMDFCTLGPFGGHVKKVKKIEKSQKCPKIKNGFWHKFGAKKVGFRVFLTPGPKTGHFRENGHLRVQKGPFLVKFWDFSTFLVIFLTFFP